MLSLVLYPAVFSLLKKRTEKYISREQRDREAVLMDQTSWQSTGVEMQQAKTSESLESN